MGVAVGAEVGEIGQSFLASNRFSGANPELGQGVPCLIRTVGMSSGGGGLESFWGLPVVCGTSANCPVGNLYTITSLDVAVELVTGIWVEVVATMGVDAVGVGVEGIGWL